MQRGIEEYCTNWTTAQTALSHERRSDDMHKLRITHAEGVIKRSSHVF